MKIENPGRLLASLNAPSRQALDNALGTGLRRTNYAIEPEHWLQKILEMPGTDLSRICAEFDVDTSRLSSQITDRLDRMKRGNTEAPRLSERLLELAGQAWLIASVDYDCERISSGHLVCALFAEDQFGPITELTELSKIDADRLRKSLPEIVKGSFESDAEKITAKAKAKPKAEEAREGSALSRFTNDLTTQAAEGKIDPVIGRDNEIRQIIRILLRRRQNNPILTGEAGVGKTAVVEGFARRIANGDVPEKLKTASLLSLDLGSLQAGAGVKGEFEQRLKSVIYEVQASPNHIILFIDEAHNLIGAGGQSGHGDAANLLKPALARGELRTIAATTWAEYKQYIEGDAALARRFQPITVDEPDHERAVRMMQGLVPKLEHHHEVYIDTDAVKASVRLSSRYISGRQLPDKSVSVLDTACAWTSLTQSSTPPQVEDAQRRIDSLQVSLEMLQRQARTTGRGRAKEQLDIEKQLENARRIADELQSRWKQEKLLVTKIHGLRSKLLADSGGVESSPVSTDSTSPEDEVSVESVSPLSDRDRESAIEELRSAEAELARIQVEDPMVLPGVDSHAVAQTVEEWTGIPVGRMAANEIEAVLNLRTEMEQSIIGQSHALEIISESIITSCARMSDPRKPIGVFLMCGTSGVGKTETALTLANLLYGSEDKVVIIDMSQLKSDEMAQSKLFGAAPGYVGYGKGGVMEAVRRKPYCVVLLDEFEKAHKSVQDLFYQIFDTGFAQDGEGRKIDFRSTVIFATTNTASDLITSICADPETLPAPDAFIESVFPELQKQYESAFLGRMTIVPYYPLADEVLERIVRLKLDKISRRFRENYDASLHYGGDIVRQVLSRCTEADTGARNIDHILNRTMLPELSREILRASADDRAFSSVTVELTPEGSFKYDLRDAGPTT